MRSYTSAALAATSLAGVLACGPTPAAAQVAPNPVAADASPPATPVTPGRASDPWERTNRALYRFNQKLDPVLLRPPAVFYHHAVPTPVRGGVRNMLSNLTHPVIFLNDVLQAKPLTAAKTAARFVVNSTIGIGGMIDVAGRGGALPYHAADFGQTLGRYGVKPGPYVYLPLLGPTTVRDIVGRGVDSFADPFNVVNFPGRTELGLSRAGTGALDARDGADPLLKDIQRTATDPYVTTRSLYLQNRRAFVRGGATTVKDVQALPDFGPEVAPEPVVTNSSAPAPAPHRKRPRPRAHH